MPLYEYRCGKCGHQFESYRRISEAGKEESCPACGGRAEKKMISLFRSGSAVPSGKSSCGGGSRRSPFG